MPNYIINRMSITAPKVVKDAIRTRILDDYGCVEFNRIIPLDCDDRYEAIEKWGTRAEAIESETDFRGFDYSFETVWETPRPIFKKLSELFPTATFRIKYASEDVGYQCGIITAKNGVLTEIKKDADTIGFTKALLFACKLWDETPHENGYKRTKDGTYVPID